jgi:hypothetical protein
VPSLFEYTRTKGDLKRQKQDEYIALRAQGVPHTRACKEIGRTRRAVDLWRRKDEAFLRRLNIVLTTGRDPVVDPVPNDFTFRRKVFFHHDTPWHHKEIIDAIEETGTDEITLIIAPPESAKTTALVDLTCDTLGVIDHNYRTCFVTAGQGLAKKIANQVRNRLTDTNQFAEFIQTYGPFKPASRDENKPWGVTHFTISGATHDEKESSVEALGVGSRIYGTRFNRIVYDDAQELVKGILTPPSEGILTSLRQMAGSRLVEGGAIFVLGSRLETGDLYELLLEQDIPHRVIQIPALFHREDMTPAYIPKEEMYTGRGKDLRLVPGVEEKYVSYWPEWWPLERLARKRDLVGEEAWFRAYMQRPQAVAAQSFSDEALDRARDRTGARALAGRGVNLLGVDPAFVGWAGFVGATCNDTSFRTTYIEKVRNLANVHGLAAHLDVVCGVLAQRGYRPDFILIEADFYAQLHDDSRVEAVARKWSAVLEPHETRNNRRDPAVGINRMPSSMLAGDFSIPYATEEEIAEAAPLLEQLRKWRPDVAPKLLEQDLVMGAWIPWRRWVEQIRDTYTTTPEPKYVPDWLRSERRDLLELLR